MEGVGGYLELPTHCQSTCKDQSDRTCALGLAVTSVFVFLTWLCATKHELNNYAVSKCCSPWACGRGHPFGLGSRTAGILMVGRAFLPRACSFTDRNDLSGVCPASFTVRCRCVLNRGRLAVSTDMLGCHIRARRMTDIEQMEATWDRHPQHKSIQSN